MCNASASRKIFRQINSLVTSLVKPLLSRNFCQKRVREKFRNFHSVMHTLWKLQKFSLTEKKFRQINYLVISLVKPLLSRNLCQKSVRVNFCNFYTVMAMNFSLFFTLIVHSVEITKTFSHYPI